MKTDARKVSLATCKDRVGTSPLAELTQATRFRRAQAVYAKGFRHELVDFHREHCGHSAQGSCDVLSIARLDRSRRLNRRGPEGRARQHGPHSRDLFFRYLA